MKLNRRTFLASGAATLAACTSRSPANHLEVFDRRAARFFKPGAQLEQLGSGYGWSEGPSWDFDQAALYFTDVPGNKAYRWSRGEGVSVFLDPSGGTRTEGFREPGANGLWYEGEGKLLVCNHGERRVERLDIATGQRTALAATYDGKPFNSPNDVVKAEDGTLYFTDPPYGLEGGDASPLKQQDANGVYRLSPDGRVTRLFDDLTRPNGVGLSPDGRTLYITQSDPALPILRAVSLDASGMPTEFRTIVNFSDVMGPDNPGLPDGMTIAATGEILIGGPGGVLIVSPDGTLLARIRCGSAAANCCFGEDGRTLFITAHDRLLRLETRLIGSLFA